MRYLQTRDEQREFCAEWRAGVPITELTARYGISRSAMNAHRRKLNLPERGEVAGWTPARLALAQRLYQVEGRSASQVAAVLGLGCTRNAVIGKAHRMGWAKARNQQPSDPSVLTVRAHRVVRSRVKPPKPGPGAKTPGTFSLMSQATSTATESVRKERAAEGQKAIARASVSDVLSPNAVPFLDAQHGCKWPIGEGMAMMSCCNKIARGVYCEGHAAVAFSAFQPAERDRADRRTSSFTRHDRIATPRKQAATDGLWDEIRNAA